jgi:hypothetical protein
LTADDDAQFAQYQEDPARYIREKLGWEPWSGDAEHPGQQEVIDAYVLALRQQHEKLAWELGEIATAELQVWQPGEVIKNHIRIEAGHTVGKTKLASGLVNHFFDCFVPSIIYAFAPGWDQIHDLLFKEIKADRRGKGLPGRILDLALKRSDNHFAKGRATNDAGGQGTERAQGQHGKYLMFVLDEAEGIADFVWNAVDSMTSGGISIVLMLANPRTRSSKFHKASAWANVRNFRISCLSHPNVRAGRELVPGAVKRDWVNGHLEKNCEIVQRHDPDHYTFEVPWQPGIIYKPNTECLFRVLGIAPANVADRVLIPPGRYEAALKREAEGGDPTRARIGIDVARGGKDYGTGYVEHGRRVRRYAQWYHQDTHAYVGDTKELALELAAAGVTSLHIRVDGTGGYGAGVVDNLMSDVGLQEAFEDFQVIEVQFGSRASDPEAYADCVTEMYAEAGESLKALAVASPPEGLEGDLTEREYKWANRHGQSVKKLEEKDAFKKRKGRSPDDGDGFVLCVAPDHLFVLEGQLFY